MAVTPGHRFGVEFDEVFPYGVYGMSVEEAIEFGDGNGKRTQARDAKAGNERVWRLRGIDRDPEARRKEFDCKVTAPHMPVLPGEVAPGTGLHPVVFEGLTVTAYVDDKTKRLAYSYRATGISAPQAGVSAPQANGSRSPKSAQSEAA